MKRAIAFVFAVSGVLGAAACGGSEGQQTPAGPETAPPAATEPPPSLAEAVYVDDLAVYQAVKVSIVSEGERAKPNAPVIAGRPALVRAHAKAATRGTRPASLEAELTVRAEGRPDVVVRDRAKALVERDDGDLDTTFDFELAEDTVTSGATLSLTLTDAATGATLTYPTEEEEPLALGARADAPSLRIKFVPIRYDAAGGRLPDLDASTVEQYRASLYKMYPAAKVDLDVRAPLPWASRVEGSGEGWDELLDAVIDQRYADRAPDDVYYVGIFTPAASAGEYCRNGCVMGVAPAAGLREVGLRVAMIVGYPGEYAEATLAQELAHAMGREHAPCGGAGGPDRKYPYARGGIGVWGYDLLTKDLIDPDGRARDFMGYCQPVWVSDYTFRGLYERMTAVEKTKRPEAQPSVESGTSGSERLPTIRVTRDGRMRPGPLVSVLPGVAAEGDATVTYESATGAAIATGKASVRSVDGTGSSLLVLRDAPQAATHVRVEAAPVVALRRR